MFSVAGLFGASLSPTKRLTNAAAATASHEARKFARSNVQYVHRPATNIRDGGTHGERSSTSFQRPQRPAQLVSSREWRDVAPSFARQSPVGLAALRDGHKPQPGRLPGLALFRFAFSVTFANGCHCGLTLGPAQCTINGGQSKHGRTFVGSGELQQMGSSMKGGARPPFGGERS